MEDLVADSRGEVTLRFAKDALAQFIELLNASNLRAPANTDYRLTFRVRQFAGFPGEAVLEETMTRVEEA